MPKVKNPLFSQEARGGIGGLVYNTWRGINYVKTNTSPTGQGTAKRLAAQALISAISKQWANLTDANRAAWGQYAIDHPVPDWTGSPKRLTGMNWFMSCAINSSRMGAAAITVPPVLPAPNPMVLLVLSKVTTDLKASWTTPVDAVTKCEFLIAGPLTKGRRASIQQAKYVTQLASNIAKPAVLLTAPAIGRYTVFVRVHDQVEGLSSTWVSAIFDMT